MIGIVIGVVLIGVDFSTLSKIFATDSWDRLDRYHYSDARDLLSQPRGIYIHLSMGATVGMTKLFSLIGLVLRYMFKHMYQRSSHKSDENVMFNSFIPLLYP